jgi:hypothetical protein
VEETKSNPEKKEDNKYEKKDMEAQGDIRIKGSQIILGLEEIENFKDAEVTFPDGKGKESNSWASMNDEVEDKGI